MWVGSNGKADGMQLSIMLSCQTGMTWPLWMQLTTAIEELGFSGVYLSDHFPENASDSLEAITALTYLASHRKMLRFGTLVSPMSIRDPVMLARQARMIDDLSGGRMLLGIGTGYQQEEHDAFGYSLGDIPTQMTRLREGAHVIVQLMRGDQPVTYDGQYYHLKEAFIKSPLQKHTPLLIGGNGPKSTLPIVAKYADAWNCQSASVEVFKQRSALLDTLLPPAGRALADVKRTLFVPVLCWQNATAMANLVRGYRRYSFLADLSDAEIADYLKTNVAAIMGSPENVVDQLQAYAEAGADEIMMATLGVVQVDYLELLAKYVLPHFSN
jgi:alkanesulfonate monooxygenase SsuD/methylene tetrahydromethanopterin reductase-like flavin-dependent oxidoreductase (luciferase family)